MRSAAGRNHVWPGPWANGFLLRPLRRIVLLLIAIALALCTNPHPHSCPLVTGGNGTGSAAVEKFTIYRHRRGQLVSGDRDLDLRAGAPFRPMPKAHFGFENLGARLRAIGAAIPANACSLSLSPSSSPEFSASESRKLCRRNRSRGSNSERRHFSPCGKIRRKRGVAFAAAMFGTKLQPDQVVSTFGCVIRGWVAEVFHFFWKTVAVESFSSSSIGQISVCRGVGLGKQWLTRIDHDRFFRAPDAALSFSIRRGDTEALELWGVWRNGERCFRSNISPNQVLGPRLRHQPCISKAKRRSATEIVACVIGGNRDHPPDAERAIAILKSVFQYQPL